MRRYLSALLAVCLCCGLLAGCGGGEKDGIKTSSDFDSATNQIKFIQGYRYEIPVNWEENNSTDTNFYFYPDNGLLMVSYEEAEGASITDESFRKIYSQNVSSGFEKYELLSDYEREIAGQKAYCEKTNFTASGRDFKGEFVAFDYHGGIISFMMGTYSDSDINYDEDFEKIINSIELESGPVSTGENKIENATDIESIKSNVDIKAVQTQDGLICAFITNNNEVVVDELNIQINYKDESGATIDLDEDGHDMILPGNTVVSRMEAPDAYSSFEIDTTLEMGVNSKYENHADKVAIASNQGEDGIIVEITNNSEVSLDEVEVIAVLYQGEEIVTVSYPSDIYDIPSGKTVTEKIRAYGDVYDRFEVYLNQAHTFGF